LSPIIDAGNTSDCPATDQRGVARPEAPACDIGALEVEPPLVSARPAGGVSKTAATLNGTVTPNTLEPAAAVYHFEWGTTTAYGTITRSSSTPHTSGPGQRPPGIGRVPPDSTYHLP